MPRHIFNVFHVRRRIFPRRADLFPDLNCNIYVTVKHRFLSLSFSSTYSLIFLSVFFFFSFLFFFPPRKEGRDGIVGRVVERNWSASKSANIILTIFLSFEIQIATFAGTVGKTVNPPAFFSLKRRETRVRGEEIFNTRSRGSGALLSDQRLSPLFAYPHSYHTPIPTLTIRPHETYSRTIQNRR